MSTNYETQLRLGLTPINPAFRGDPQQYAEELVRKLRILAPFGTGMFISGSVMPSSNQGPWLKDGKQWWVWDEVEKTYVPLDISASIIPAFYLQDTTPPTDEGIYIWLQTNSNRIAAMYVLVNGNWDPLTLTSGTTAQRPVSPRPFQEYYDTDISALLWYERGAWRTKDGVRGDIKQVSWETGEEALRRNPGWEIFGTGESVSNAFRARALGMATKDKTGSTPTVPTDLATGGLTARPATEVAGAETDSIVQTEAQMPRHAHEFGMEDRAQPVGASITEDPLPLGDPGADGRLAGDGANYYQDAAVSGPDYIARTRMRGKEDPDPMVIDIVDPTLYLWTLRKT